MATLKCSHFFLQLTFELLSLVSPTSIGKLFDLALYCDDVAFEFFVFLLDPFTMLTLFVIISTLAISTVSFTSIAFPITPFFVV